MVTALRRAGHRTRTDWSTLAIHPALAAAYPVLFLFAQNIADQVTLNPLWAPLAAAAGGAAVVLVVGRLVLGDWQRSSLLTTLLAVRAYDFVEIQRGEDGMPIRPGARL